MKSLGDFDTSTIIYGKFTTYRPSTGAAFTLGGTPALSVYKDNSTTQSTAGVTLTVDFDSVTGLHHFAIDTSADGAFYSAGSFFDIVITTGTVDSVSVVGTVVASFTIRRNSALKPTTAGRTLDVSSGGEAGIDWANIGSPTTAVNLSATNIDVDQVVASVSGAVGSVTGLVAANLDVAVSSRSTYAGADTAGTTTLLSRLTSGRASNLDNLDATISSRSTYAGADTSGTTTLLSRLSAGRATNLDNLDATVSSRSTLTAANVKAEVLDVLNVDTFAEPTGAPSATTTLAQKLGFIYQALRNRVTVTATTKTFHNDAGTAQWSKALSDDGTTYSEAEGS